MMYSSRIKYYFLSLTIYRSVPAIRSVIYYIPGLFIVGVGIMVLLFPVDTNAYDHKEQNVVLLGIADENHAITREEESSIEEADGYEYLEVIINVTPTPNLVETEPLHGNESDVYKYTPSVIPYSVSSDALNGDFLFDLVNEYRMQNGLTGFMKSEYACSIAEERSNEIYREMFITYNMHAGLRARGLAGVTENIIHYSSEQGALQWWKNSGDHRAQMLGSYSSSCTQCTGKNCAQIFIK